jgi:hypothetical protein
MCTVVVWSDVVRLLVSIPAHAGICRSWHACDNNIDSQKLMMAVDSAHVFPDVLAFLPLEIKTKLLELRPDKGLGTKLKEEAHLAQRAFLQSVKGKMRPDLATAFCVKHQALCKVMWSDDPKCPVLHRPLKSNYSGPMCLPWTSMGSQMGYADPSVESYNAWLAFQSSCHIDNCMDTVFVENSDKFPWEDFVVGMGGEFTCVRCVFSLSMLGVPMERPRTYGVAINNASLVWVGPSTEHGIAAEFRSLFQQRVELEADDYAGLDTPEGIEQVRESLARNRGVFSSTHDMPIEALLAPTQKDVWCQTVDEQAQGISKASLKGTLVVDLSQSTKRARGRSWFPSPTKSTLVASVSKHHIFTKREVDLVLGWPVIDLKSTQKYQHCVPARYWELSTQTMQKFTGNSMSLQQMSAWSIYISSNIVRRDKLQQWMPPLRFKRPQQPQQPQQPQPQPQQDDVEPPPGSV